MEHACVVGIAFEPDLARTVVVDARDGSTLGVDVKRYRRWAEGAFCDPVGSQFRQHPLDHLEAMEASVAGALAAAGRGVAGRVRGIAAGTTGSTPALADAHGRPLSLTPGFEADPDAMFVLWKDHVAASEAEEINRLARTWGGPDFTRYQGGSYSSEWFWAKALHLLRANPRVAEAGATFIEHCDWIPAVLTGATDLQQLRRSRCAAGHAAMWHADFGGYPADAFLAQLHPRFPALKASLGAGTFTSDQPFGALSPEWAGRLGLPREIAVAVGAFDAHVGAVGGGIRAHRLVKVMGPASRDLLVLPRGEGPERLVPGICGQVDGSVLPGAIGYEAGQSAFGDVHAWLEGLLSWPLEAVLPSLSGRAPAEARRLAGAVAERLIPALEAAARALPPEETGPLALDWLDGRRTPDADRRLRGALTGLTLGTDAPRLFKALVEATAYGARAIVERFRDAGLRIDGAIAIGGVARERAFVMQCLADVMNLAVEVPGSHQAVALGAAVFAATAAGLYPTVEEAQQALVPRPEITYRPDAARAARYDGLYRDYQALGAFVEQHLTR